MGTFQMIASSGTSSSSSSHSASRSFTDFRVVCCQDCLRALREAGGETSRLRELLRERVRGAVGNVCEWAGEGDRDRRPEAERLAMFGREGAEGEVKPLRSDFPGAWSCDWGRELLSACPFKLGYRGFAVSVRLRNEGGAGCGWVVERAWGASEDFGASKTTRLDGETGIGKVGGPCTSSRLMSSKCERSLGPMMSDRPEEWKLDDLDDFEFVRSGGLPGGPPSPRWASAV